jgi:hypothetical protein
MPDPAARLRNDFFRIRIRIWEKFSNPQHWIKMMDFAAQRVLARLHGAGGHQLSAERCQAQARGEAQENRGREEKNGGETGGSVIFWYGTKPDPRIRTTFDGFGSDSGSCYFRL